MKRLKKSAKKFCRPIIRLLSIPVLSLTFCSAASANVFAVNTTSDVEHGSCTASACSLRDAIKAANANPGQDSITFDQIDRNNPANACDVASGDVDKICHIKLNSVLPDITDSVILDGSIAEGRSNIPGSVINPGVYATLRPGIELDGELIALAPPALRAGLTVRGSNASNSIIKGLILNRMAGPGLITVGASNLKIQGNYIGTDVTGTLAATYPTPFSNANCTANCFGNRGSGGNGMVVGAGDSIQIGGNNTNERNVVAGNSTTGISLYDATHSSIVGNFIGTDVFGTAKHGNRFEGMEIREYEPTVRATPGNNILPTSGLGAYSSNNLVVNNISIDSKARANFRLLGRHYLVKANASDPGTDVIEQVDKTTVIGNRIGFDLNGNEAPSAQASISISDMVSNVRLGFDVVNGTVVPNPNLISTGAFYGVGVTETNRGTAYTVSTTSPVGYTSAALPAPQQVNDPFNVAILYNQIYGRGLMPIDITGLNLFNGDGVKPNDLLDSDVGPNNYQNYPVLDPQRSLLNPALVKVVGTLNSKPNTSYWLQFYSNNTGLCLAYPGDPTAITTSLCSDATHPFFEAPARVFVGEVIVTTDSNGNASYNIPATVNVPYGSIINGTATRMDMVDGVLTPVETSEFSEAVNVDVKGSATAYLNADGAAGGDNGNGLDSYDLGF